MIEQLRRAALLALLVVVALRVVCGELSNVLETRPPSPARPKGYELRTIKRLPAGKIVALRLQVVIA